MSEQEVAMSVSGGTQFQNSSTDLDWKRFDPDQPLRGSTDDPEAVG